MESTEQVKYKSVHHHFVEIKFSELFSQEDCLLHIKHSSCYPQDEDYNNTVYEVQWLQSYYTNTACIKKNMIAQTQG